MRLVQVNGLTCAQEREFQNIFTFSPGFEAATLKFPSGSNRREPTAALLAELTQIAANQQAAALAAGIDQSELPSPLEEALAALQIGGTTSTSSSTTPSAAVSLTPSAQSVPTFGTSGLPQLPTRRQTIGFARFKTRADALAAKEHLQGRKIDVLTGATLKAEMAKKNLHTKRATSGEELVGMLLRSGRLAGLVNAAGQVQMGGAGGGQMGIQGPGGPGPGPMGPGMLAVGSGAAPVPGPMSAGPTSAKEAWDSWPVHQGVGSVGEKTNPTEGYNYHTANPTSSQSNASTSPPLSVQSPNQRPSDSKALLALAEEADELEGWTVGGAVGMGVGLDGYANASSTSSSTTGSTNPTNRPNQNQPGPPPPPPQSNQARRDRERERSQSTTTTSGPGPGSMSGNPSTSHSLNNINALQGTNASNSMVFSRQGGGDVAFGSSPPGESMSDATRGLGLGGMGAVGAVSGVGGGSNPADQNPPVSDFLFHSQYTSDV